MVIYDNFLNTDCIPNNIVLGNLRNFECECPMDKAFIVYCTPSCIHYNDFVSILKNPREFKKYISFRDKKIFDERINLTSIFNTMDMVLNNGVTSFTIFEGNQINIQKFFFPYYNENIVLKTKYWNLLSYNDFMTQVGIIYGDEVEESAGCGINVELNYDLFCPSYKYPIRFVFQYTITFA